MTKHKISLNVTLDPEKCQNILIGRQRVVLRKHLPCKNVLLSIWIPLKNGIEYWSLDEKNDGWCRWMISFQSMMTMAIIWCATKNEDLSEELKAFAREFKKKGSENYRWTKQIVLEHAIIRKAKENIEERGFRPECWSFLDLAKSKD